MPSTSCPAPHAQHLNGAHHLGRRFPGEQWKAFAIVSDEHGEQSVYQVGEIIPDSGKLLEVDKYRAILELGGNKVVLELPKEDRGDSFQGFTSNSSSNCRSPLTNRPYDRDRR
jgi:hypothetical protein